MSLSAQPGFLLQAGLIPSQGWAHCHSHKAIKVIRMSHFHLPVAQKKLPENKKKEISTIKPYSTPPRAGPATSRHGDCHSHLLHLIQSFFFFPPCFSRSFLADLISSTLSAWSEHGSGHDVTAHPRFQGFSFRLGSCQAAPRAGRNPRPQLYMKAGNGSADLTELQYCSQTCLEDSRLKS